MNKKIELGTIFLCMVVLISIGEPQTSWQLYSKFITYIVIASLFILSKSKFSQVTGTLTLGAALESMSTHLAMDLMGKEKTLEKISSTWIDTSSTGWISIMAVSTAVGFVVLVIAHRKRQSPSPEKI